MASTFSCPLPKPKLFSNISEIEILFLSSQAKKILSKEKGEGDIMLRKEAIPSLFIILMGILDCVTTVLGVFYAGAKELNPAMALIVNSNVGAFLLVKMGATIFIALSYIFARQILQHLPNKNGKSFFYSIKALTFAYIGITGFLALAVVNNLLILMK